MKDFVLAALPWVLLGTALAVVLVLWNCKAKKPKDDSAKAGAEDNTVQENQSDDSGNYMALGMSLGTCAGIVLGVLGVFELSMGISLGMLWGMIIGMNIPSKKKSNAICVLQS